MKENRGLARALLLLALAQVVIGGAVVLSRLNFLATGLHLAVALGMLTVLFHLWAREIRRGEALP
jgi:heme A synthase